MEDERPKNGSNVATKGSPESSCSKNNNNDKNTTTTNHTNKEQDRFLPIANVGRIMKKVIPGNGKISKDAKETVQECVSEFISFVTGEASDKCQREKRKTINGDDIIWAITLLGFEDYVNPLKQYLAKYKELEGEKLHFPKQQQNPQQQQPPPPPQPPQQVRHSDHEQNISYSALYSPANLISQPPFATTDQSFSLPFAPSSIQKQFQKQEHMDSVGHW